MTRLLLLILVLANLIAFLAWQGTLDAWGPGGTALPVSAQVAPERLKVMVPGKGEAGAPGAAPPADPAGSAGQAARAADPTAVPSAAPAATGPGASPANPSADPGAAPGAAPAVPPAGGALPPLAAGAAAPMQCLEAGPLDEARLEPVRDWARGLPAGQQFSLERRAETSSFMVYLPPGAIPGDAQRRIDQLRQRGIADLFLIGEGPLKSSISLGIFRSQEGARVQVERLVARGVTGALITPVPGRTERSWARLTRGPSVSDGLWEASRAQLQSVSGIAPGACPGPAS